MGQGVERSGIEDEGSLLQACTTGDHGRGSGRSTSVNISAEILKSIRESRSFRHATIPDAVSSPASAGCISKNQIAPSTYCFTEALKAIQQTRCGSGRESMVPIRFLERKVLNSKWDEAEKYISNPLSGEVPIQCLSSCVTAETWPERAHDRPRSSVRSISKSAPLPTPTSYQRVEPHPVPTISEIKKVTFSEVGQLKRRNGSWMRDVGTQITPLDCSSSSPSITSAPLEDERSESFRLMGRRCFIFQRKPKPEALKKESKAAPRKEKQGRSNENEARKKVRALLGWKMWEACNCKQEKEKEKKKKRKRRRRSRISRRIEERKERRRERR
ncbi:uncharacterized protein LOC116264654 isoform X2 [Nymphaea colorata]|uniref:uncharacterized protein LOC116264654 isoform X2 n=1 Tax=Nymphaea colorata TaxID=210225 RepID=UPI00129DB1D1|nr:uncharacterized protein LOC116264654 isoform X2 [Nymphaea colorata]